MAPNRSSALLTSLIVLLSEGMVVAGSSRIEELPDEVLSKVLGLSNDRCALRACPILRQSMLPLASFPLNEEYSYLFIYDANHAIHRTLPNARSQVRLNLGIHFTEYFHNRDFRAHVDSLVDNPDEQIWSDLREFRLNSPDVQDEDISLLAKLPNLQELNLSATDVTNIEPLRGLVNLQSLSLKDATHVQDIGPLAELTELRELYLSGTAVQLLDPLTRLVNLQRLTLPTNVADIGPLRGLVNLEELGVGASQWLVDFSPLATLTNLRSLDLADTQVTDLRPLSQMENLESLYLSHTPVTDLWPLADLANLQMLELSHTLVDDISELGGLDQLHSLVLCGTQVVDISAVAGLQRLEHLDLCDTQVHDVSSLGDMQSLRSLFLSNTEVNDLSALADLENLQELLLEGNLDVDLRPLADLLDLHIIQ